MASKKLCLKPLKDLGDLDDVHTLRLALAMKVMLSHIQNVQRLFGFGLESSVLISLYSADVPSIPSKDFDSFGANLDIPLNFGVSKDPVVASWYESWKESNSIHMCELHVDIKGFALSTSTFLFPVCNHLRES